MSDERCKALILSDFNASNFAAILTNQDQLPRIEAEAAPYGQVLPLLLDPGAGVWSAKPKVVIVWTRPQGALASFQRLLDYEPVAEEDLLAEVDEFSEALRGLSERAQAVFIPTWTLPSDHRGYGSLDMRPGRGWAHFLMKANLRLARNLLPHSRFHLLNAQSWIDLSGGKSAYSPKLWYLAKVPFSPGVFQAAASDVRNALDGLEGRSRKLLIVDLDDTLWGGVVGDVGVEGLRLGGHDHLGEAFVDFQKALKGLTRRGILLAVVSKNEEAAALDAIERHPEMVLRKKDFVGWRINWQDKAENIADLVKDLNLGLQSVVFIDDNPAERGRVREALPEVLVPDWPVDKMLYKSALMSLGCFDATAITSEDHRKTEMYAEERERTRLRTRLTSHEDWLSTLDLKVSREELGPANLDRAAQLLNKTNQMNLTTRRLTQDALLEWCRAPERRTWAFRVADRYGDSGLTGLASVEVRGDEAHMVDFILSCRVMGRRIEECMVHAVAEYARSLGLRELVLRYSPTEKNKPCLDFLKRSRLAHREDRDCFVWNLSQAYPKPAHVLLEGGL